MGLLHLLFVEIPVTHVSLFVAASKVEAGLHCANSQTTIDSINSNPCDGEEIPFPPGFGNLLRLPFGLDIEQCKVYGQTLFANRDFMGTVERVGMTGDGHFRFLDSTRCTTEMRKMNPVGAMGEAWTPEAFGWRFFRWIEQQQLGLVWLLY